MTFNLNPAPKLITFDTYGTLIDWESAIVAHFSDVLKKKGHDINPRTFYTVWYYGYAYPAVQGPFQLYRELLRTSFRQALVAHRIPVEPNDGAELGDVMAAAKPFPDAVEALKKLKTRYRLATISNSQDDIISHAVAKLAAPFDLVITGETTHTYKPNPALFELVMARAGVTAEDVVHVAQSQYVDLPRSVPMGMRTVWINRQAQPLLPGTPAPHAELRGLSELPQLLGAAG